MTEPTSIFPPDQRRRAQEQYEVFFADPVVHPPVESEVVRAGGNRRVVVEAFVISSGLLVPVQGTPLFLLFPPLHRDLADV